MSRPSPVFIVGYPRSGTTLVQSMVAAHSEVFSLPETHFFSRMYPRTVLALVPCLGNARARKALDRTCQELKRAEQLSLPRLTSRRRLAETLVRILDEAASSAGACCWVEKTPSHIFRIQRILKHIPTARVIHVVRNPLDAITSRVATAARNPNTWRSVNATSASQDWNEAIAISARYIGREGHCFVSYDDLLLRPEVYVTRMAAFLSITEEPDMLRPERASGGLVRPHETWKTRNSEGISRTPDESRPQLPEDEIDRVRTLTREHEGYGKILQEVGSEAH